jgi:hypothetical protein
MAILKNGRKESMLRRALSQAPNLQHSTKLLTVLLERLGSQHKTPKELVGACRDGLAQEQFSSREEERRRGRLQKEVRYRGLQ